MKTPILARKYRAGMQTAHSLGLNTEGLWEPADQLIQHCLPPPNVKNIKALCELLIRIEIDTDWAISFEMEALLKQANLSDNTKAEATRSTGRTHPVFYGILRIDDLPWPNEIKAQCIDEFVALIHENTAPSESFIKTEHYMDVYQIRDALISKYAKRYNLKVHPQTEKQLFEKRKRLDEVATHKRLVGAAGARAKNIETFWESPPRLYINRNKQLEPNNDEKDVNGEFFLNNDLGLLTTGYQKLTSKRKKLRWDRENVPSPSDQNHLSHTKIIHYVRYLLTEDEPQLAALAILGYASALDPKRLFETRSTPDMPTTLYEVCFDADKGLLRYGIIGGATNFHKNDTKLSPSQIVTLEIPAPFNTFVAKHFGSFKDLIKKDYPLNSFSRQHMGVRPTLSRIAKSSLCNLHFRALSRSDSYLLRGKIPIQHQNEHAYYASNNFELNNHFQKTLRAILSEIEFHKHSERSKHQDTTEKPNKSSRTFYAIGSQLGNAGPFDFYAACSENISKHLSKKTTQEPSLSLNHIYALNELEVYYYFLLQFSNAGRAIGANTHHETLGQYSIYRDKDSKHFKEKLFIPTSPLALSQFNELIRLRSHVLKNTALSGIFYKYKGERNLAYKIALDKEKKVGEITKLNALAALKHIDEHWEIRLPFNRSNTSRHMTATYAKSILNETLSNAWLNHHIDGYAPFSPTSPANSKAVFDKLHTAREDWLHRNNFKVIEVCI